MHRIGVRSMVIPGQQDLSLAYTAALQDEQFFSLGVPMRGKSITRSELRDRRGSVGGRIHMQDLEPHAWHRFNPRAFRRADEGKAGLSRSGFLSCTLNLLQKPGFERRRWKCRGKRESKLSGDLYERRELGPRMLSIRSFVFDQAIKLEAFHPVERSEGVQRCLLQLSVRLFVRHTISPSP